MRLINDERGTVQFLREACELTFGVCVDGGQNGGVIQRHEMALTEQVSHERGLASLSWTYEVDNSG